MSRLTSVFTYLTPGVFFNDKCRKKAVILSNRDTLSIPRDSRVCRVSYYLYCNNVDSVTHIFYNQPTLIKDSRNHVGVLSQMNSGYRLMCS